MVAGAPGSLAVRFGGFSEVGHIRLPVICILIGVVAGLGFGCGSLVLDDAPAPDTTPQPQPFLGVAEDRTRRIEEDKPEIDSRLWGITTMTEVRPSDYATYLQLKTDGRVAKEETHDGFVFFAVEEMRHAPLPAAGGGAVSASITVTNRFKAPIPKDK